MQNQSFLYEIRLRRVPQVAGLYIAAAWMAIEIGDWVIERFLLAPEITSYIFVAMITFLPSVMLLAYQYGKKRKDPWHKSTFVFLPLNLVLAGVLPVMLVQPVKATEVKTAVDETGNTQEYVVPKQQYLKNAIAFFWQSKNLPEEEQWLQYATPWLLSNDLDRNEFISMITPFEHPHLYQIANKAGYKSGLNEPLALQLDMVQSHSKEYFITGNIDKQGQTYNLLAQLYQSKDRKVIESFRVNSANLFEAVDTLSEQISYALIGFASRENLDNDLPVAEHTISQMAALETTTMARVNRLKAPYNNDYLQQLEAAHEIDEKSLAIQKLLFLAYSSEGKVSMAETFGKMALAQSYKMTREEKFLYQGYLYALNGDQESHLKVLSLWVELYPNSVDAHSQLAQYHQAYAANLKIAEQSLLKVSTLMPNDMGVYYRLSKLYETMSDLDKAIEFIKKAIALSADDINGSLSLAQLYEKKSEFKKAKEIYEKVSLLDPSNKAAKYLLALNNYKIGNFDDAEKIIQSELTQAEISLNEKIALIHLLNRIYVTSGEINKALDNIQKMEQAMLDLPVLTKFNVTISQKVKLLEKLGKTSERAAIIHELKDEFEPPYSYSVDLMMVGVYKSQGDVQSINQIIEKFEGVQAQESTKYIGNLLEYSYLSLYELTQDYVQAKDKAYVITERLRKSANGISDSFSYLSWKVKLARLYRLNELHNESERVLREVLREFPASVLAKKELVDLYIKTDRLDDARQLDTQIMQTWSNADNDYVDYQDYLKIREALGLSI